METRLRSEGQRCNGSGKAAAQQFPCAASGSLRAAPSRPEPEPRVSPLPPPASLLDLVKGLQPFRLGLSSKLKPKIRCLLTAAPWVCLQGARCLLDLVALLLSPLLLLPLLLVGAEPGQCSVCINAQIPSQCGNNHPRCHTERGDSAGSRWGEGTLPQGSAASTGFPSCPRTADLFFFSSYSFYLRKPRVGSSEDPQTVTRMQAAGAVVVPVLGTGQLRFISAREVISKGCVQALPCRFQFRCSHGW